MQASTKNDSPSGQTDNKAAVVDKSVVVKVGANALKKYLLESLAKHIEAAEVLVYKSSVAENGDTVAIDLQIFRKFTKELPSFYSGLIEKMFINFAFMQKAKAEEKKEQDDGGFASLQLVDNDVMEEQLAIEGVISRCERKSYESLYGISKRLSVIFNLPSLKIKDNPVGPAVLMNNYVELLKSRSFSSDTRKILYKSFDETVIANLETVYQVINDTCIQAGVLPTLPKPRVEKGKTSEVALKNEAYQGQEEASKQNKQSQSANGVATRPLDETVASVPTQHIPAPSAQIPEALYSSLVEMAQAQRTRVGVSENTDGLIVMGDQLPTEKLLTSLTDLQKTSAEDGANTKESLRSQIGMQIQVDGQRQPYTEQDETLIDVVAMFFDVILQDRHLPDAVRVMLAQLQIPILKVSMIDKEFFAKKSHPARRFLNALSKAGLGISQQNKQIKNLVFEKMETLVERVLMEFNDDVQLFAELDEEFAAFMEQQQRQIDVIEERSRKVTESSEQLELARRQAAYEIALRMQGQSFPEFVNTFLDEVWKDVLVLALLRREREPKAIDQCLSVVDRLMVSVIEQDAAEDRKEIISGLPRLIKDLKIGLENISYDFHEATPWFKDLETWHRHVLLMGLGVEEETTVAEEVVMVELEEDYLSANLEDDLLMEVQQELAQMPKDKFTKQVNKMQIGDWVEYKNAQDEQVRAKLSWKSSVTLNCLFVDERGVKALDMSLSELAEQLRSKQVVMVGQEDIPLVERVLTSMKDFIGMGGSEPEFA